MVNLVKINYIMIILEFRFTLCPNWYVHTFKCNANACDFSKLKTFKNIWN